MLTCKEKKKWLVYETVITVIYKALMTQSFRSGLICPLFSQFIARFLGDTNLIESYMWQFFIINIKLHLINLHEGINSPVHIRQRWRTLNVKIAGKMPFIKTKNDQFAWVEEGEAEIWSGGRIYTYYANES